MSKSCKLISERFVAIKLMEAKHRDGKSSKDAMAQVYEETRYALERYFEFANSTKDAAYGPFLKVYKALNLHKM